MAAQAAIQQTLQTWQPYYEQELTDEDGGEILNNWAAYVELLSEWATSVGELDESQ